MNHNVGLEKVVDLPVSSSLMRALTLPLGCHPSKELSASLWEGDLLRETDD